MGWSSGFYKEAEIYVLSGEGGNMRAARMTLDGRVMTLDENNELPDLSGETVLAGKLEIAPLNCAFIVL